MELLQTPELAASFILDATLAVVDTPLLLADEFDDCQTNFKSASCRSNPV